MVITIKSSYYLFSLIRNKLEKASIKLKLEGTYMRSRWIVRDSTNSFIMCMKSETWRQFGIWVGCSSPNVKTLNCTIFKAHLKFILKNINPKTHCCVFYFYNYFLLFFYFLWLDVSNKDRSEEMQPIWRYHPGYAGMVKQHSLWTQT